MEIFVHLSNQGEMYEEEEQTDEENKDFRPSWCTQIPWKQVAY